MTTPLQPTTIQKIGKELAIAWSDGVESYLDLEFLRRHCPCAVCNGEPDVMGSVVPPVVSYAEGSFGLSSWQVVGGYGIQPTWSDGHSSGIYSYALLRRLAGGI
jgi:DUF971 family protein